MSSSFSSYTSSYGVSSFNSRKLLMRPIFPFSSNKTAPNNGQGSDPSGVNIGETRFDSNVVMVLSVLLCALICSLGINSIIRCVLWCKNRVSTESNQTTTVRLINTGIKKKILKSYPTLTYSAELTLPGLNTECIICLSEFGPGEPLRILPKCNHGFHQRCIDKWLMSHSSCPTCRHNLTNTCIKMSSSNQASSSESSQPPLQQTVPTIEPQIPVPPPPQETVLTIDPEVSVTSPPLRGIILTVEPEGFIRSYHGHH
ncbi:hypothetical protein MKX01_015917 [Papaver californicum]|nr:hypothetical protein MKX01_015917 [Papaver californicum]